MTITTRKNKTLGTNKYLELIKPQQNKYTTKTTNINKIAKNLIDEPENPQKNKLTVQVISVEKITKNLIDELEKSKENSQYSQKTILYSKRNAKRPRRIREYNRNTLSNLPAKATTEPKNENHITSDKAIDLLKTLTEKVENTTLHAKKSSENTEKLIKDNEKLNLLLEKSLKELKETSATKNLKNLSLFLLLLSTSTIITNVIYGNIEIGLPHSSLTFIVATICYCMCITEEKNDKQQ